MNSKPDEPFQKLVEVLKIKVSEMEQREGEKPTFEDYINEMIEDGVMSFDNLESQMRGHALAWSGAKLGRSNWKELYKRISNDFVNTDSVLATSKNTIEDYSIQDNRPEVKKSKSLKFIKTFFKEVDDEVINVFKNVGLLKILVAVLLLFVLWYFASLIGEESSFYSIVILISIVSAILYVAKFQDKSNTKIGQVVYFVLSILGLAFSLCVVIAIVWGVFDFLKDAFYWFLELFN